MQVSFSSDDIAQIAQAKASRGATTETIRGIAGLVDAAPGDLSFLGNGKYKSEVAATRASVVLVPGDFTGEPKADQRFLVVDNPSVALARICSRIEQSLWPKPTPGIHPTALVAPDVKIPASATVGPLCIIEAGVVVGEGTYLQAQVFVGRNARIGEKCWLMPGVVIATECEIGSRVQIQPGVIIGSDGFGYEFVKGRHEKVPQVGIVRVGDDVEIGANTAIDRARFAETRIGEGTKIDNLVQIGHNVIIGRHCMICGQVGISGSSRLEDYVVLGGQVGVAGHLTIGKGVKAGGKTGINTDIEPGLVVNGNPAIPYLLERRLVVLQQRLPDLFKRVDALEEQLLDAKKSSS